MMLVNPLVADAMKRAGEQVPETGIIAMSNGTPIACAADPQKMPSAMVSAIERQIANARKAYDELNKQVAASRNTPWGYDLEQCVLKMGDGLFELPSVVSKHK